MNGWSRAVAAASLALAVAAAGRTPRDTVRASADIKPPQRLMETGLYLAGQPGTIDPRNRPFAPQYPLWSDGAAKARWIYLPPGQAIDASDERGWEFPAGTRLWKEFRFGGRPVETRLLWKVAAGRWVAASYVWNDSGTDAQLAPDDGVPDAVEIEPGRRHSIPSVRDCAACHGQRRTAPLGFTALQLSDDRDPNAIHGEPLADGMVTVRTLVSEGLLAGAPASLASDPPRIRARSPQSRAVLGYLSANCGSCHDGSGDIAGFEPSLHAADLLRDADAVAESLVGHATRWQVPGRPDGTSMLIDTAAVDASAILARMRSRRPSSQMPPLGSVIRDRAAIDAIRHWIETELPRR